MSYFALWRRFPQFRAMLSQMRRGDFSHVAVPRLLLSLLALLYVVSPVDFIPEVFLGPLGLGDDAAALAVALASLVSVVDSWTFAKYGQVSPDPSQAEKDSYTTSTVPPASGPVIPGVVIKD